jgi:enoyl-CoA hydratase/carnithine racemase
LIELTLKNGVYEMALSQPPNNEIGMSMLAELERCVADLRPEEAHTLILHSTVSSGFCAGADLRELYSEILSAPKDQHLARMRDFLNRIHAVMNTLDSLPLTTVGVIHGICFGGGFELALTSDILIADATARFCFPELRLGIIPCFGGIPRLKREALNPVVRDLLLTGRSINAQRAHEVGLVSQKVAAGEALNVARKLAEQSAKYDSKARIEAKRFMKPVPRAELEEEKEIMLRLFTSPVVLAALKKFVESQDVRPYLA